MSQVTWNQIQAIIQTSIQAIPRDSSRASRPQNSLDNDDVFVVTNDCSAIIKSVENIDYFDLNYNDDFNSTASIVNVERHVFYRDVYVFVNKLKNLAKDFTSESKIKKFVLDCLRESSLIWYSIELTKLEKNLLRNANLDMWSFALIRRFKERDAAALIALQTKKYIMTNARNERISRTYVQDIIRHAKTSKFISIYNQLLMTWNNLDLEFRMQISKPTTSITLNSFFEALNFKVII